MRIETIGDSFAVPKRSLRCTSPGSVRDFRALGPGFVNPTQVLSLRLPSFSIVNPVDPPGDNFAGGIR